MQKPQDSHHVDRRRVLTAGVAGLAALGATRAVAEEERTEPQRIYRFGVISARIEGKPQRINGHTWHFAQYFHPTINMPVAQKYLDPGNAKYVPAVVRNPKINFHALPFPDTKITHYYEPDPEIAALFAEVFPGVKVARSVEEMVSEVDAVFLGDASGYGDDHYDLVAPGLEKGLPTFCDKPIGGTVAGTRKILELARKHKAPIMSSSLFRHCWGIEEALRMRDSGEWGDIQYVIASLGGGYREQAWYVYGQHPTWTIMTLLGPGVEAVSMYAREAAAHALVTYPDRMPGEIWYGRPDVSSDYCSTSVHFTKKTFVYTPAIEGSFAVGHHYEMFNMAAAVREMVKTGVEPVPHQEILEVTAIIQAAGKSLKEKSRLVALEEVMQS